MITRYKNFEDMTQSAQRAIDSWCKNEANENTQKEKDWLQKILDILKLKKYATIQSREGAQRDVSKIAHAKDMTYSQLEEAYKRAVQDRDLNAKMRDSYKHLYLGMIEGADLNVIERRLLIKEIKKHDPDFNYQTIIDEADKIYEEQYSKRK